MVGTFVFVNYSYGWDTGKLIKPPVYVNLDAVVNHEDNLVRDSVDNWMFFKNLHADNPIEWGYIDYQRNIMGFRMDVEYEGVLYPQCVLFEVENVAYAKEEPAKLKYIRNYLLMCDGIETWIKETVHD